MKMMKRVFAAFLLIALVLTVVATASASGVKDFIATGNVNVRSKPNLNGKILTSVSKGKIFSATDYSVDKRGVAWFYGRWNGKDGWVSGTYLDCCDKATTGNVNMRKEASLNGAKVTALPKGVNFYAKACKQDDRGVTWYYGTYGKCSGWVSGVYLKNN